MPKKKEPSSMKRQVLTFAVLGVSVLAGAAYAVQTDIGVSARMRVGLTFSNLTNMNFTPSSGHIDFNGTPDPTTDFVTMGTNGAVAAVGLILEPSSATGTPGSVDINSDGVSSVYITCTAGATLTTTGGVLSMSVDNLQISMNTGDAYGSSDYPCVGLGGTPHSYTLTGTDKIILGGRLVGPADVSTTLYSSANTSGMPAKVKVIYQ